jgi:CHAT domain-containing protein/Tfp pilus assembly protein PilF
VKWTRAGLSAVAAIALLSCVDADHRRIGTNLDDRARWYHDQGRYAEAESLYERSLAIRERAFGPSHPETAAVLDDLAGVLQDEGRYTEAEPLYQRALMVRERSFGPGDPKTAATLDNLAALYRNQGRYAEAEPLFQRALMVRERSFGPDHPKTAATLDNLAQLYRNQGRYGEAKALFQHALAIRERAFGPDDPETASTVDNLAALLQDQGRYFEAEPLFQRALRVRESALGPDHPKTVATLDNLAELYLQNGRYPDAELLLQRALAAREAVLGPDHPKTAATLDDLAELYHIQGRYDQAERLFQRALAIRERDFGPDHLAVAGTLDNIAALRHDQGRYAQAEPLYERALAVRQRAFGSDHPQTASTLDNIAALYYDQGRFEDALVAIRRATAIHRARAASGVGRISGATLREQQSVRGTFEKHVRIAAALAAREPGRRPELTAEAFEVAQLAKASTTGVALARMAARFATGDDALATAIRARQDTLERWRWADRALIEAASRPPAERQDGAESRLRAQRDELDRQFLELDTRLRRAFPEYAELESPLPVPLAAVQRLLGADEALVLYLVSNSTTVVWAVRSDRAAMRSIPGGHDLLAKEVRQLRAGVEPRSASLFDLPRFDVDLARTLYDQLLAPIAPLLEDAHHLLLVADGPLESLPFHLLVTAEPAVPLKKIADYRKVPWLARTYATTTLPAVSSLRALRRFAGAAHAPEPFLGVGDPMLDADPGATRSVTAAGLITASGLADTQRLRAIPALPETAGELLAMADTLKAGRDSLVLQDRATERAVKAAALDRYRVLAFATHGLVAGDLNNLAEPALVLTPPEVPTKEDDGLLTASEVARLKLDADWVILSACNTAAPDGTPGAEGLSGLAKAFLYAGSRALLVSHWPVNSHAAVVLTTGAISALAADPGIGRAEALRRSMVAMLSDPAPTYFAHPLFWAPFVVVGEGGPEADQ